MSGGITPRGPGEIEAPRLRVAGEPRQEFWPNIGSAVSTGSTFNQGSPPGPFCASTGKL